eukprot:scaffold198047_cov23-Tisochrysis_lutea.AAC.1
MPEAHMCGSKADLDGQQALGGWLATRLIHIGLVAPSSPLVGGNHCACALDCATRKRELRRQ